MAAGYTGAPAAGGAGQDDAPEPLRGLGAAGEHTASDHAPVAPGASEEEAANGAVEAGQDDAPEPEEEQEGVEGGKEERVDAAGEDVDDEEEEDDEDKEDAPTHLPFAPELLDDTNTTTVGQSYTISLIRQLIPKGSNVNEEFRDKQGFPEERSVIPQSSASVSWAQALLPDEILSRILWVVENTESSTFLEKASADVKQTTPQTQSVTANSIASPKEHDGTPEVLFNDEQVKCIKTATCQRSKRKNLRTSMSIGSIGIWFISMALLVLLFAEARPAGRISQPVMCNHNLLAKQVNSVCLSDQATPLCCEFIIFAVDKGECICDVMKDGVLVNTILIHYRSCGGLKPDIVGTIKNCSTPDVPSLYTPAPQVTVAIIPNKSKHVSFYWLIVLLLVIFLGLMICFVFELRRRRGSSQITHDAQGLELMSRQVKSPRKRQTANEIIRTQQVDIPIRDDIPFVMTRARAASLKE